MREKRHYDPLAWKIPKTRAGSKNGKFNGHIDIFGRDGKRQEYKSYRIGED